MDKILDKTIREILTDLYRIDSSLRAKEADLKKLLGKMLAGKPEANISPEYRDSLKEKLLAEFGKRKSEKPGFIVSFFSRPLYPLATGLSFCLVLGTALFIGFHQGPRLEKAVIPVTVTDMKVPAEGRTIADKTKGKGPETKQVLANGRAVVNEKPGGPESIVNYSRSAELKDKPDQYLYSRAVSPVNAANNRKAEAKEFASGMAVDRVAGEEISMPVAAEKKREMQSADDALAQGTVRRDEGGNTESYERIQDNPFLESGKNPLSTFSIDVDTASYANIRRFLTGGQMPYPDAVRFEEMINYFTYEYEGPKDEHPFAFRTELSVCPWNAQNRILRIGMQGRKVDLENIPPMNLVYLVDTSGSMEDENKLPLLREGLKLLVSKMRKQDTVSIVTYAGSAGLVLPPTSGAEKGKIIGSLDRLSAGGSTAGGAGIELAYKVALENFKQGGNNRVILATDGDFNVGASSEGEMTRLIEEKRKHGIYLTVLGLGMGNVKDSMMEKLADKGNGNYAYIDTISEAKKVLVDQAAGTLLTIASDVKLQIEFNPAQVKSYRLIGYENRVMRAEDFDDDKKDAGELGAGHTVTALYEIVPADGSSTAPVLKYQQVQLSEAAKKNPEIATIKFRYKKPGASKSILMEKPIVESLKAWKEASTDMRFSMAVAGWGMLLRGSEHKGSADYGLVLDLAKGAKGKDSEGYRNEFIQLVETSRKLAGK